MLRRTTALTEDLAHKALFIRYVFHVDGPGATGTVAGEIRNKEPRRLAGGLLCSSGKGPHVGLFLGLRNGRRNCGRGVCLRLLLNRDYDFIFPVS